MKKSKMENEVKKSIQNGDFKVLKLSLGDRNAYRIAAKATLAKDKVITLRISGKDLNALKQIALKSGKRYQTYIGDILHEHVTKGKKAA